MKDEERGQIPEETQSGKQHNRKYWNSVSSNIAVGLHASKSQREIF